MSWVQLCAVLVAIALHGDPADAVSESTESMLGYQIDATKPCGTRCQIKRAMDAWGGLVEADPEVLLQKYRAVSAQKNKLKTLQARSVENEQRLGALHRLSLAKEWGGELAKRVKDLEAAHGQVARRVKALGDHSGGVTDSATVAKVTEALQQERSQLRESEGFATSQALLHRDQDEAQRLGEMVQAARKEDAPAVDKAMRNQQTLVQRVHVAMKINHGSKSDLREANAIHEEVENQAKTFNTAKRLQRSLAVFGKLEKEAATAHNHIAEVARQQQGPKNAVRVELLEKADVLVRRKLNAAKLTGSGDDENQLKEIQAATKSIFNKVASYRHFAQQQHKADAMQSSLRSIETHLDATNRDTSVMEATIRSDTVSNAPPKLHSHGSSTLPSDLASDVDKLISDADRQHASREDRRIKLDKIQKDMKMLGNIGDSNDADSDGLMARLAQLKKLKSSPMVAPANSLDAAHTWADEDDFEVLVELDETEDLGVGEAIPYVGDKEAHETFNADGDASFKAHEIPSPTKKKASKEAHAPKALGEVKRVDRVKKVNRVKKARGEHVETSLEKKRWQAKGSLGNFQHELHAAWLKQKSEMGGGGYGMRMPDPQE